MEANKPTPYNPQNYREMVDKYLQQWQQQTGTSSKKKQSSGGGSIGAVGSIAGMVALNYGKKKLIELVKEKFGSKVAEQVASDTTKELAGNSTLSAGKAYGAGSFTNANPEAAADAYVKDGLGDTSLDGGSNINYGKIGQGALGAYQGYQGIQDLRKGNYLGGGINTAAGAANLSAATNYAGAGSETLAAALPGLNVAAGLYGGYQTADAMGKMAAGGRRNSTGAMGMAGAGAAIGSVIPGVGTLIGAGVGALAGLAMSHFGSSKDKYQMMRDGVRKGLQEQGIIDQNWQGTLADGSKFDFGNDGKGMGKIDYKDPTTGQAISLANVLAAGEGLSGKSREAAAMMYTNAIKSNANGDYNKMLSNVHHFMQQRGFTPETVQAELDRQRDNNKLKDNEYQVFSQDISKVFAGAPVNPTTLKAKTPAAQQMPQPQRSRTSSPGISKTGQRISY